MQDRCDALIWITACTRQPRALRILHFLVRVAGACNRRREGDKTCSKVSGLQSHVKFTHAGDQSILQ